MRLANALRVASVVVAAGVLVSAAPTSTRLPAAVTGTASDFTLMDQDGRPVNLSDYQCRIVVLEWVNPQCPFVQRHYRTGTMVDLAEKYKDAGVVWLSINSTASASVETNKKWAQQQNQPYPVLDDHEGIVAREYGAKTTPYMFVIDPTGQIVYQGAIDNDPVGAKKDAVNYVDNALTELLAGQIVATSKSVPYGCTVKYKP